MLLAVLAAGQAAGAGKPQPYSLRQVSLADYPAVNVVVRSAKADKPPPVYENGDWVRSVDAQSLGDGKAVVLAIDRSKSMRGAPLTRASAAARQFLREKRDTDRVAVVTFGSTALAQSHLQTSPTDASAALGTLDTDPVEGTALADAVVVSSAELELQGQTSRVLILLTDGRDVRSLASWDEAVKAAKKANVVVYPIVLGDADRAPLAQLARATGGTVYTSPTSQELASAYHRIGAELRRTWRLSYTTAARPGDKITVSIVRPHGPAESVLTRHPIKPMF